MESRIVGEGGWRSWVLVVHDGKRNGGIYTETEAGPWAEAEAAAETEAGTGTETGTEAEAELEAEKEAEAETEL